MDQALRRARSTRATGGIGPHLFPEPVVIWGRNTWTAQQLRDWRPLGQGARTDLPRCAHPECHLTVKIVAGGVGYCSAEHVSAELRGTV